VCVSFPEVGPTVSNPNTLKSTGGLLGFVAFILSWRNMRGIGVRMPAGQIIFPSQSASRVNFRTAQLVSLWYRVFFTQRPNDNEAGHWLHLVSGMPPLVASILVYKRRLTTRFKGSVIFCFTARLCLCKMPSPGTLRYGRLHHLLAIYSNALRFIPNNALLQG
jgi:hypothetical protein